jgi:hypothetical protein
MTIRLRLKAALIHLVASVVLAAVIGALILVIWFPGDYAKVAHGWQLLLLILCVDSVCGPLLTSILFNPKKSRRELTLDMSLVVLIQLAALAYGVHAAFQARPVVVAFERDRFRVVTAAEVDPDRLADATPDLRSLPLDGPRQIGVRIPKPGEADFLKSVDLALAGLEVSFRPGLWRPFDSQRDAALRAAKPLSTLTGRHPDVKAVVDKAVAATGLAPESLVYLPAQTRRKDDWVALMHRDDGRVVGFAPVDGF